jgi:hypothetical protein
MQDRDRTPLLPLSGRTSDNPGLMARLLGLPTWAYAAIAGAGLAAAVAAVLFC